MVNLKEKFLILGVLLLALYMRIHYMSRSLFYDELYVACHGVPALNLYDALFKDYSALNHLGYTAVAYFTCHLLGNTEWTLRLPALLFGLGSIFLFWYWVRKYFGTATAVLGAFFLALDPAHIIWSASARGYSACIFFTILSTALFYSLLRKPSRKTALMLTITNTIACSFQVYFLIIFLAQFFILISATIMSKEKHGTLIKGRSLVYVLASQIATCLCSVLIYSQTLSSLTGMALDHRGFVSDFPLTLLRDLLSLPLWPLGLLCLGLMLFGISRSNENLPYWRLYVAILFLMIFPIWLAKPVYLFPRFFSFLIPFFFLLLAYGMVRLIEISLKNVRPFIIIIDFFIISWVLWIWISQPAQIVENFKYKFRESVQFAENAAGGESSLCAFGDKDYFFQFYAHRPVMTFKTFDDFRTFYNDKKDIICMTMLSLPMPDEHKKIFIYMLSTGKAQAVNFDNIAVIRMKS